MFQGIITNEDGSIQVNPDVFKDLFLIGNLNEFHHKEIQRRFLYDEEVQKKYKMDLERLRAFKKELHRIFSDIDDKIQDSIDEQLIKQEKEKDNFIEQFRETDFLSKTQINALCKVHKGTMLKYSHEFIDKGPQGVQLKSFLSWLKVYEFKSMSYLNRSTVRNKEDQESILVFCFYHLK